MPQGYYKDLSVVFRNFHFVDNGDYPDDLVFCFLVLTDGSQTAGRWWPLSSEEKGHFVRGTGDAVPLDKVYAWLALDNWNIKKLLNNDEVGTILIGHASDYSIEINGFYSFEDDKLPQEKQYCLLLLKKGKISGGKWHDGGPYLDAPGYFEHGPAGSIIDVADVEAWAALDPDKEIKPDSLFANVVLPEKTVKKEEKTEPQKRKYNPQKKFKYGFDVEVYLNKAIDILNDSYPWVTRRHLDPHYNFAIEKEAGEYQYVSFFEAKNGEKTREVLKGFCGEMDADEFIKHIVFCHESYVLSNNEIIDEYRVPFYPVTIGGDWHLEQYVFKKRASGDYTVYVQAGDRCAGSGREFGISRRCFEQQSFDGFLDEYEKIVPGKNFGLNKEDLIDDGQLKAFLGYVPLKPHPEIEIVDREEMAVTGLYTLCWGDKDSSIKTSSCSDSDSDKVEKQWKELLADLNEVDPIAAKVPEKISGFWGIMSDDIPEKSFVPWNYHYKTGYYFSTIEASRVPKSALLSKKWIKTIVPKGKYVVSEEIEKNYDQVFMKYINTIIPEMGYRLSGGVCEYIDAATGKIRLYFPVETLK